MSGREDKKAAFLTQWNRFGLKGYEFVPEHKVLRYRIDWALPDLKVGIEVDGGTRGFMQKFKDGRPPQYRQTGGHNSGEGYLHDRMRDLALLAEGWTVIRLTTQMLEDKADPDLTISMVAKVIHRARVQSSGSQP